ncbi:MAG: TIGR00282 family metallophosphoesterase [Clostridia bacterium]|nr:TIGR00282 family metallophosphoesterase [Clostridia bacterium]
MRLLFIGDVVGISGCEFLMKKLPDYKKENEIDVCIANGENSAQGNGVTPHSCKMLYDSGVDFITLGNHSFKRPEIMDYLDSESAIIRPYNFPSSAPGKGVAVIDKGRFRVAVISLMGTVYMEALNNPFYEADKALKEVDGCKTIIVDFHAEATAEKRSLGFYLDGKVTAVLGTHTHIQTADAQILPNGTAYITDVGMTGPVQSVLGIEPELAIKKLKLHLPVRFSNASGDCFMNACMIDINEKTGKPTNIKRVVLK